jgi:suppressor of tumorigenicity protein 13
MNFNKQQLDLLKQFVQFCKVNPDALNMPELAFFKQWLESMNATIPSKGEKPETTQEEAPEKMKPEEPQVIDSSSSEEEPEEAESDVESDREGVMQDSEVPNQEMGDPDVEVTDEMIEQADNKRSEALAAMSEGKFEEAVVAFTEVIKANPTSAPMLAKRASCFLKLKRPNAAIKDCNRAIEINPDQAQAYKWRGLSYKLLGNWESAFTDLTTSNRIDFSEDTFEAMKEVEAKAHRLQEHRRKYERKREERELRARQKRVQKARKAYEKQKQSESSSKCDHDHDHEHDHDHGHHGIPPGMFDPELMSLMQDPEVMAAMSDIMKDPSKMAMHANNPKVKKAMEMMQNNIFKGGFPGGFSGEGGDMEFDDAEMPDVSSKPHVHPSADDLD